VPRPPRADVVPLVGAAPALAVFTWWTFAEGGYDPGRWLPGTLVLLAAVAVAVVALGRAARPPRALLVALGAFAAYTIVSYLSILWAGAPGPALEGSHRTLAYLACFALFAVLPWTPRAGLAAVVAYVLVVGVAGLVTVMRLAGAEGPAELGELFIDARATAPLGYQNAAAALWTMAAAPALVLAARRELPALLRPVLLAEAGLLLALALLSQSRGWLVALPVIVVASALLSPERVRLLLFATPVAVVLAVIAPTLLEPFDVAGRRPLADIAGVLAAASHDAARAALLGAVALAAVGAVAVLVDRRVAPSPAVRRWSGHLVAAALVVAVVAGGTLAWRASESGPVDRVEQAWNDFRDIDATRTPGQSRFTSLGSTRYDFWRVGVEVWRDRPLLGAGQDNFAHEYLRLRRSPFEEPRWTHSLELRLLAHTGLLGTVLFAAFLLAAVASALARRQALPAPGKALVAAALLPGVVWLVHGSVDWFWEYPALSGPALALTGLAGRAGGAERAAAERPSRARTLLQVALVSGVAVAMAAVAVAWAAERATDDAEAHWRAGPAAAFAELDRAGTLNPLSARPSLVEGIIAAERRDLARAREAFAQAAEREPQDWFSRFELGLTLSALGRDRAARRSLAAARARNPGDPLIREALRRLRSSRPLTFAEANAAFVARVQGRLGRRG
jgi:hypothetical protein